MLQNTVRLSVIEVLIICSVIQVSLHILMEASLEIRHLGEKVRRMVVKRLLKRSGQKKTTLVLARNLKLRQQSLLQRRILLLL